MLTKTDDVYRVEIIKRLSMAKKHVENVLLEVESDNDWKDIHTQTETAVMQLRKVSKLLAQYHLAICIVGKHRNMNAPIVREDVEEIIKTYRYLN
jgi:DNA-binding FrmR family transcriptional regulator